MPYLCHACRRSETRPEVKSHVQVAWDLLCAPNTDIQEQVQLFKAKRATYRPPFSDFVNCLIGRTYVWRSRSNAQDPCLIREMMFLSQLTHLCVAPNNEDEMKFNDVQKVVLQELEKQESGKSIWGLLLAAETADPQELLRMRKAFPLCLEHLQLFVVNDIMGLLGIEVSTILDLCCCRCTMLYIDVPCCRLV
jgi:hypothetical protein